MSKVWFSLLVTTAAFWGTAVVKRSPYSYETTPPVRQWADHPMKLVSVPTALTPQQQAAGAKVLLTYSMGWLPIATYEKETTSR